MSVRYQEVCPQSNEGRAYVLSLGRAAWVREFGQVRGARIHHGAAEVHQRVEEAEKVSGFAPSRVVRHLLEEGRLTTDDATMLVSPEVMPRAACSL